MVDDIVRHYGFAFIVVATPGVHVALIQREVRAGYLNPHSMTNAEPRGNGHLIELDLVRLTGFQEGFVVDSIAVPESLDSVAEIERFAVGVDIEGEPITDFFSLDPRGIAEHCYFDPDRFYVDPASVPTERAALQRGNITTLKVIAGERMYDPTLLARLGNVPVPTLVLWGEADRIVTPAYGAAFADGFPNARFEIVPRAGHLPQLEQPDATFALIDGFRAEAGMAG